MSVRCLVVRQGQLVSPPVAMLRWEGASPEVSILDTAAESNLREYLHTALSIAPFRIRRRKRAGSRAVDVAAEKIAPSDADFLGRWAAKLTFSSLNRHNFIFTAAKDGDAISISRPTVLEQASDIFELSGTFRSSLIACPCGGRYPFLTVKCPQCEGADPLGVLWEKHGSVIVQKLSDFALGQLTSNNSFRESLQTTRKAFEAAVVAVENSALTPLEADDEATASRKLLSYYEGVFRHGCLNEKIITALKVAPGREYTGIINGLRNTARGLRSIWKADCTAGWNPTEAFATKCQGGLIEAGRPAMQGAGHTAQQMIKVAAQFGPFHGEFKRRVAASEDDVGTFFKGAWRAFKAVKTMGVSELIRAGLKGMKDQKFRERFERFSKAFDQAVASCAKTKSVIDHSLALHHELLLRLAKGMRYHMIVVLAEDYAAAKPDEQARMADCLAKAFQCPPLKRRALHDRGLDAQRKRKLVRVCCLGGGLVLLLAIIVLVVMLSRH